MLASASVCNVARCGVCASSVGASVARAAHGTLALRRDTLLWYPLLWYGGTDRY